MGTKTPRNGIIGCIILNKEWAEGDRPVALTRSSNTDLSYQWTERPDLTKCDVHTWPEMKRAIREGLPWTKEEAVVAYRAVYNPKTRLAEPQGGSMSFAEWKGAWGSDGG